MDPINTTNRTCRKYLSIQNCLDVYSSNVLHIKNGIVIKYSAMFNVKNINAFSVQARFRNILLFQHRHLLDHSIFYYTMKISYKLDKATCQSTREASEYIRADITTILVSLTAHNDA